MSFLAGENQRGFFKQPIGSGRKRRVPVCWPFNVDLFGFVTGKGIDLPVEAADAPPVVAQPPLVSTKVKDTQPVPVNAFGETLQSFSGVDPDHARIAGQVIFRTEGGTNDWQARDITLNLLRQTGDFVIDTFDIGARRPYVSE